MSSLEGKVAAVAGASAAYVECVQPVTAGDVPSIVRSTAVGLQATAQSGASQTRCPSRSRSATTPTPSSTRTRIPTPEFDRLKSQCTSQLYQADAAQAQADLAGDTIVRAPIKGGGVPNMQLMIQAKLAERRKTFYEE